MSVKARDTRHELPSMIVINGSLVSHRRPHVITDRHLLHMYLVRQWLMVQSETASSCASASAVVVPPIVQSW